MLVTVLDIVLRKAGLFSWPGTIDVVQLCIMTAAFLSIPFAFITDGHVSVEILSERLGPRGQAVLRVLAAALGLVFMVAIAYYGLGAAMDQVSYGDRSQTIGIPIIWYWLPLLTGAALSVLATLLIFLRALLVVVTGREGAHA